MVKEEPNFIPNGHFAYIYTNIFIYIRRKKNVDLEFGLCRKLWSNWMGSLANIVELMSLNLYTGECTMVFCK